MPSTVRHPGTFTASSRELAAEVRARFIDESGWEKDNDVCRVISWRGGKEELELGREYCESSDFRDKVVGTLILRELGWSEDNGPRTFIEESVDILIPLLTSENHVVVANAACALGFRGHPRATPHLVAISEHPHEDVRLGVVHGLLTQEDPQAIECLIRLTKDADEDVRDWAVFGLGSQIEVDTPQIREALFEALNDPGADGMVSAEAIVGLAERGDDRAVAALLREWEENEPYGIFLEAASLLGDPRLIPALEELLENMNGDPDSEWIKDQPDWMEHHPYWKSDVEKALQRCRGEIDRYGERATKHEDRH